MIYFDFSDIYKQEYQKRLVNYSFYEFLDKNEWSLETFIKDILIKEERFRIIAPFVSEEHSNYFIWVETYNLFIKGDFVITSNNGYFKVKDLITTSVKVNSKEKEFSFKIGVYNTNRNCHSDFSLIKSIIKDCKANQDYKIVDFVNRWNDYLEFERKIFKDKIGFYKSEGFEVKEVYQVKRSYESLKEYEDQIYFDDTNNYLYLERETSGALKFYVVEFLVTIAKDEGAYSSLHYFASQEIEMANEKEALKDNKLVTKKELEFDFKTTRLGSLLIAPYKVKEDKERITYCFSKFYNDEDSYYFNLNQIKEYIVNNYGNMPLLVNILSGDISLYKRGKEALNKVKEGDFYNPYLLDYLFKIHDSETHSEVIAKEELVWSNENLDEYQKEAIYRAINSNSIFLLQGPPGTGKTQTISELVYQFNKLGKRVLLSSQTHVAIDNVLERLPNELNILPIRLVSSERKNKVDSLFLPNRVIDNLYGKIRNKYLEKTKSFDLKKNKLKDLWNEYQEIKEYYIKYQSKRELYLDSKIKIDDLNKEILQIDSEITSFNNDIKVKTATLNFLKEFMGSKYELKEYVSSEILVKDIKGFGELINKYNLNKYLQDDYLDNYLKCFVRVFKDDVLFNNDFYNLMSANENSFKKKLGEIQIVVNEIVTKLNEAKVKKENLVGQFRQVELEISKQYGKLLGIFIRMDDYYYKMFNKVMFASRVPFLESDKLAVIEKYLLDKEEELTKEEENYKKYEDIYLATLDYLDDDLIALDREKYTKYLTSNNVNVYALTCNANSRYLKEKNNYLRELDVSDIDLNNIDFDVVIIDEVSKASDIELLIPILYGKSVILVGDHRQLPPLFKYKEGMVDSMSISNKSLVSYQELVETSLFKKLFSEAKDNKFMLIKQYRSHKQIMDIVNLFYDDKLVLGNSEEQNNTKEHYLEVTSNNLKLFTKNIHTYWFNSFFNKDGSVSYEKKLIKGGETSSSFYNEAEIEITKELLLRINDGYKENKDKQISVGVISLYKDQVNLLKKEVSKWQFENIRFNKNKISTVDEFQGKEEDIVIVNLVRNNKSNNASEFVKKFERINVALSRARRMLIIVGAKEFFANLEVEMERLDDSSIVDSRKLYRDIYKRCLAKIDRPFSYFSEVDNNEN